MLYIQFTPTLAFDSTCIMQVILPTGFTFNPSTVTNSDVLGQ